MDTDTTALQATFEAIVPTLATKADVKAFEARFDAIIPTLATKADLLALLGSLESQIHRGQIMLCKWIVATMVGMFIGFGGMFFAASNFLRFYVQAAVVPYAAPAPLSPSRPSNHP